MFLAILCARANTPIFDLVCPTRTHSYTSPFFLASPKKKVLEKCDTYAVAKILKYAERNFKISGARIIFLVGYEIMRLLVTWLCNLIDNLSKKAKSGTSKLTQVNQISRNKTLTIGREAGTEIPLRNFFFLFSWTHSDND